MNASLGMAFEPHRIKVTVTENRKSVSGQCLNFGLRYFNATWFIVSFMKI
jgi:hypothetical protein